MDVVVNNRKIRLTNDNFITAGGEGELFGKDDTIYKIYLKDKNSKPTGKIKELSQLDRDNIVNPKSIINDTSGKYIGYTMEWKKNTVPLCKLITNTFRKQNNIKIETVVELVDNIKEGILYAHDRGFVLVDGNEFNYLVDDTNFTTPYFIDVDSWKTPNYPATAVMPSVRDYHTNEFNKKSDWFTFGIVACQLFLGIHPYKGTHPDYSKKQLEQRMKDNASIFSNKVSLPNTVRNFDAAPSNYIDWFKEIFHEGKRTLPPDTAGAIKSFDFEYKSSGKSKIDVSLNKETSENIVDVCTYNKNVILKTPNKIYVNHKQFNVGSVDKTEILFTTKTETPVICKLKNGKLSFESPKFNIDNVYDAENIFVLNNRCFVKNRNKFFTIKIDEFGDKAIPSVPTMSWNVLPNATKVFDGIVVSNVLGKPYFTLPYEQSGQVKCFIDEIPEIEGYKIANAKREKNVVQLVVSKDGTYDKLIFKFNDSFTEYNCFRIENVDTLDINFAVLDHGVVVSFDDHDMLNLTSTAYMKKTGKKVNDKQINGEYRLLSNKSSLMAYKNNKLYNLTLG